MMAWIACWASAACAWPKELEYHSVPLGVDYQRCDRHADLMSSLVLRKQKHAPRLTDLLMAVSLACLIQGDSANAQSTQPADDAQRRHTLAISVTLDWTNAYYFRGILQENQGIIVQP